MTEHAVSLDRVALHELADGGPDRHPPRLRPGPRAGRGPDAVAGVGHPTAITWWTAATWNHSPSAPPRCARAGEEAEVPIEPNEPTPSRRFLAGER